MKVGDSVIITEDYPSGSKLRKGQKVKIKSLGGISIVVTGGWWLDKREVSKIPDYFKNDG